MSSMTGDPPPYLYYPWGLELSQPPQQGWLCPACGRGNAPFVPQCSCIPAPPLNPATLKSRAAQEIGSKGGKARAKALTPEQRTEIASKAAQARWARSGKERVT